MDETNNLLRSILQEMLTMNKKLDEIQGHNLINNSISDIALMLIDIQSAISCMNIDISSLRNISQMNKF